MKPHARYMSDLFFALVIYTILLICSRIILRFAPQWMELGILVQVVISLSPMLGVVLTGRSILTFSRSWDELQRRMNMEAGLLAAIIFGFGSFAWGFLEGDVGIAPFPTIWIMPVMMGLFGLCLLIVRRQYR